MERVAENSPTSPELQQRETISPNASSWEKFYSKFSPTEKKQFIRNQTYLFGQMIQKDLRRIRESLRKLRENDR